MVKPISQWRLDDNLDTDVVIDSEGSNDGAFKDATGTPTTAFHHVVGHIGTGALDFDGTDDYINCGNDSSLRPAKMTLSAWVKPDASALKEMFIKGTSYTNQNYEVYQNALKVGIRFNDGNFAKLSTNAVLSTTEWTHIVVTYDKDLGSDNVKLYVNGELEQSWDYTTEINADDNDFIIGAYPTGAYAFDGKIDEVSIFSKALSQTEVTALWKLNRLLTKISKSSESLSEISKNTGIRLYLRALETFYLQRAVRLLEAGGKRLLENSPTTDDIYISKNSETPTKMSKNAGTLAKISKNSGTPTKISK